MLHTYSDPVAKLLTIGEPAEGRRRDRWLDYLQLGLTESDVPELIRMAADRALNGADPKSLDVWAPLHAWRALGQLRAQQAVQPLVRLFDELPEDDWLPTDLMTIFAMIGPASIAPLTDFLANHDIDEFRRLPVTECLEAIAEAHPHTRDDCVGVLLKQLEKYETNGETLNAFVILALVKLNATEAISLIRKAFASDLVDLPVQGDLEDVEIEMGLRTHRSTPRPRLHPFYGFAERDEETYAAPAPPRRAAKVGRNQPCPCGSGKKFKKCCLHAWRELAG